MGNHRVGLACSRTWCCAVFLPLVAIWRRISTVHAAEPSNKVRIGYPSSAVSTLPFDIAKEKGFYAKAGLNVEYIQMRSALGPQAILNGNIHFFTSPQSAINAAVAGLPLVVVLSLYRDTPWVLVTTKEINKTQDLIGKRLAISDIRSSPYYFARAGLRKLGLEEKQVSLVTTGGTSNSFANSDDESSRWRGFKPAVRRESSLARLQEVSLLG